MYGTAVRTTWLYSSYCSTQSVTVAAWRAQPCRAQAATEMPNELESDLDRIAEEAIAGAPPYLRCAHEGRTFLIGLGGIGDNGALQAAISRATGVARPWYDYVFERRDSGAMGWHRHSTGGTDFGEYWVDGPLAAEAPMPSPYRLFPKLELDSEVLFRHRHPCQLLQC